MNFSTLLSKQAIEWILSTALTLMLGSCLGGCVSPGQEATQEQRMEAQQANLKTFLGALEASRFKGNFHWEHAGSPLALHLDNSFTIGSRQATFRVSGDVDFTNPPRPASAAPTPNP